MSDLITRRSKRYSRIVARQRRTDKITKASHEAEWERFKARNPSPDMEFFDDAYVVRHQSVEALLTRPPRVL